MSRTMFTQIKVSHWGQIETSSLIDMVTELHYCNPDIALQRGQYIEDGFVYEKVVAIGGHRDAYEVEVRKATGSDLRDWEFMQHLQRLRDVKPSINIDGVCCATSETNG